MSQQPRVVGIAGSLRDHSYTRLSVERTLREAGRRGARTELLDLREYDLPVYDGDADEPGDAAGLAAAVRAADSVVLGTPSYHGSYSSVLKTALDYCGFEEFEDTTVGLLAVSGGGFPLPALEHLRTVCRALEAWTLPTQVAVPDSHSALTDDDEFVDEAVAERAAGLGRELVAYANVAAYPDCPSTPAPAAGD